MEPDVSAGLNMIDFDLGMTTDDQLMSQFIQQLLNVRQANNGILGNEMSETAAAIILLLKKNPTRFVTTRSRLSNENRVQARLSKVQPF